jgi:glycosyltransferase involved in cell wall biosynthesis
MSSPKVSVIVPTYNHADYLGEAIQSVLDQTFSDFELIVVNDASTDNTDEVVGQYDDPRLKYIKHQENRYAAAARNTGIKASCGELIAFFDGDDLMHPEKLQTQVTFLKEHPEIGLTYCSRFEIDVSGLTLSIVQAPNNVTLSDLVLGYPYAPSEVVLRREWPFKIELFDESFVFHAEDPDFFMRLALKGCRMAGVDKVLNYRRRHANRVFNNLEGKIADAFRSFENTFTDPTCPSEVLALREKSLAHTNLIWSYIAFAQNETSLGQELIRKSIRFDRTVLDIEAKKLLNFWLTSSIRDGGDHETILRRIFAQLPLELAWVTEYENSTIAYGYLVSGAREVMWGRRQQGEEYLVKAEEMGVYVDEPFLRSLTTHLLNYEAAFGSEAAQQVLNDLIRFLQIVGSRKTGRSLSGSYFINRAFQEYHQNRYQEVPGNVLRALSSNLGYLTDRGVLSIFIQSLLNTPKQIVKM